MRCEAILTQHDLRDLFAKLAPLEIRVGESATLVLESPTEVSLVALEGVNVVCDATLHWPLLGVDLPVHMRQLTVRIHPAVRPGPNGNSSVLVFTLQIERTGVSLLPASFDDRVTTLLNKELVTKHVELAWNFGKTLTHVFSLPAGLVSAAALGVRVESGTTRVTENDVRLVVEFGAEVQKRVGATDRRSA
jgi:hypothetical protein